MLRSLGFMFYMVEVGLELGAKESRVTSELTDVFSHKGTCLQSVSFCVPEASLRQHNSLVH